MTHRTVSEQDSKELQEAEKRFLVAERDKARRERDEARANPIPGVWTVTDSYNWLHQNEGGFNTKAGITTLWCKGQQHLCVTEIRAEDVRRAGSFDQAIIAAVKTLRDLRSL